MIHAAGGADGVEVGPSTFDLLARLSAPVWLIAPRGQVVWLNASARSALSLAEAAAPATIAAVMSDDVAAALTAVPAGRWVHGGVLFHTDTKECLVPCRLFRLEGFASGSDERSLTFAEALVDVATRTEVLRLTEQLAAISGAFPDVRLVLRRDGTITDWTAADITDLPLPAAWIDGRRLQDILPEPGGGEAADALRRLAHGSPVAQFGYTLDRADGSRIFDGRVVALPDAVRVMAIMRNVTDVSRAQTSAAQAHQRLLDALECISEGFVLFDEDDRMVLCNNRFRDIYSAAMDMITPGVQYEALLRAGVARGIFLDARHREEAWIAERLRRHREPGEPFEERLSNGRWLRIEERRTSDGGIVGIRTDITTLRARLTGGEPVTSGWVSVADTESDGAAASIEVVRS